METAPLVIETQAGCQIEILNIKEVLERALMEDCEVGGRCVVGAREGELCTLNQVVENEIHGVLNSPSSIMTDNSWKVGIALLVDKTIEP